MWAVATLLRKKVPKWNLEQDKYKPKQSPEAPWDLLRELMGPKRHQIPKSVKNETDKCEIVDAWGPPNDGFCVIFASFGC